MTFGRKFALRVGIAFSPRITIRQFFSESNADLGAKNGLPLFIDDTNGQLSQGPTYLLHGSGATE